MRLLPFSVYAVLIACLGCGSSLSTAVGELDAGRLPEADQRFRALEPDVPELSARDRARYALYRGLTHLALGDAREAERWLAALKRAHDADAACLDATERGRLLSAWRSLGHMPGE